MESQPQNPELMINPENFHPCSSESRGWSGRILSGLQIRLCTGQLFPNSQPKHMLWVLKKTSQ